MEGTIQYLTKYISVFELIMHDSEVVLSEQEDDDEDISSA